MAPPPTTIFLASSSALKADRDAVFTRIAELNEQWHGDGIFLKLLRWERFDRAMSATRKQDDYNQEIAAADIFVLLAHTKVGTYSREEFERAWRSFQATGKPRIYTWFKRPPHPNDPSLPADYGSVREMLRRLRALEHFEDVYRDADDLLRQLGDNLVELRRQGVIVGQPSTAAAPTAQVRGSGAAAAGPGAQAASHGGVVVGGSSHAPINITYTHAPPPTDSGASQQRRQIDAYLRHLADQVDRLPTSAQSLTTTSTQHQALALSDVYVALDTTHSRHPRQSLADALAGRPVPKPRRKGGQKDDGDDDNARQPVSAIEALAHHPQLTLLGSAGSGKTSFGAHVLAGLARAALAGGDARAELGADWPHGALLPVRVVLRVFAEQHAHTVGALTAQHLWQHIAETAAGGTAFASADDARQRLTEAATARGALVLFDGLDECGPPARQQRVLQAVHDFSQRCRAELAGKLRTLTTARPYAFHPDRADAAAGRYQLADLSDEQVQAFVLGWYHAAQAKGWPLRDGHTPEALTDALVSARARADLHKLTTNPLLLTLTTTLNLQARLPDDRVDLYEQSVLLLLERWNLPIGADQALISELKLPALRRIADLLPVLQQVAFDAHAASVGSAAAADIAESRLVFAFKNGLTGSLDKASQVVEYIERRAGLLMGKGAPGGGGERQFQFPHRSFQEYLAARHLAQLPPDELAQQCLQLAGGPSPGHWQLVLTLAGRIAPAHAGAAAADALVDSDDIAAAVAAGTAGAGRQRLALMAARMLAEMQPVDRLPKPRQRIVQRIAGWLVHALPLHPGEGGMVAAERAEAGDLLALLGDPRFDAGLWHLPADPMLGFVRIEADPGFCIGTCEADRDKVEEATGLACYHDEINAAPTPVATFCIARRPVTVAQFRAFLDNTGTTPGDANLLLDPLTRPVRFVSWHEARAYSLWVQQQLLALPEGRSGEVGRLLRQGWQVRLPTELQWERAARGPARAQVFSWGDAPDDERANQRDTGLGSTSAVGCFPANAEGRRCPALC